MKIPCYKNWCRRRESNSHDRGPLPPQDSVSTSSTTSAHKLVTIFSTALILLFPLLQVLQLSLQPERLPVRQLQQVQ